MARKAYSLRSLAGVALQEWKSERSWDAIAEIHSRGCPDTVSCVHQIAHSANWRKRALGSYVICQLRTVRAPGYAISTEYAVDVAHELLRAGLSDSHEEVVEAAVSGFGHRPHPAALPKLVELSRHPNAQIRLQVAFALGRYPEQESIEALLSLATDINGDVRNWATFGLGTMHDADTPRIRAQLWANIDDADADVSAEALLGLARRRDERVLSLLEQRLTPDCRVYELEAAEEMKSGRLLTLLESIRAGIDNPDEVDSYWLGRLDDAIHASRQAGACNRDV